MRVVLAALFFALVAAVSSSCGTSANPSMPSAVAAAPVVAAPTPIPITPGPAPATNASVEISAYHVTTWTDEHGLIYFNQKFTLAETGGKSGATIQTIVSFDDGHTTDDTGPSCWVNPIRVAPHATLQAFDADWDSLSYCAPWAT